MKFAICFLTVRPSKEFFTSLELIFPFKLYDIYIVIDDNFYEINNPDNRYNIIKIDNRICEMHGFKNSVLYFKNKCCSRDKGLYYFRNTDYHHIWFIEEDVLIPHINTLTSIDNTYKYCDLICQEFEETSKNWNLFPNIHTICHNKINLPYYNCMICAVRLSKYMLSVISNFANKYNTLFLDEALFTTLAMKNNLNIEQIKTLNTLSYRADWQVNNIKIYNFYHPIKEDGKRLNIIKMFSYNNYKSLIKNSEKIFNKTYSWGDSNQTLTFFNNFELICFGKGYFNCIDYFLFEVIFGGYVHILEFNEFFSEFTSTRTVDGDKIKGKIINKPIKEILFKKYKWGDSEECIEFLENGNLKAFGRGNYFEIRRYVIKANFGNEIHILNFNENFEKFTSIREKDGEIIYGCLK